ncbi:MAG: hypothetical protein ACPGWR_23370, partial [Ardenticatenaceae bacterium]
LKSKVLNSPRNQVYAPLLEAVTTQYLREPDLLAQVGLGRAIILMAYANKNAFYAIKMMALPREFLLRSIPLGELG